MANDYKSNPILIDTVAADIDIALLAFKHSNAPVFIKKVVFTDPTAADNVRMTNALGDIVVDMLVITTNEDISEDFIPPLLSQGLIVKDTGTTITTGKILIYLA